MNSEIPRPTTIEYSRCGLIYWEYSHLGRLGQFSIRGIGLLGTLDATGRSNLLESWRVVDPITGPLHANIILSGKVKHRAHGISWKCLSCSAFKTVIVAIRNTSDPHAKACRLLEPPTSINSYTRSGRQLFHLRSPVLTPKQRGPHWEGQYLLHPARCEKHNPGNASICVVGFLPSLGI